MTKFVYTEDFEKLFNEGLVKKPERQTKHSAGYDVFLPLREDLDIKSGEFATINLGFYLDTEENLEMEVFIRSSVPKKRGLIFSRPSFKFSINQEAALKVYNYTKETVTLKPNDRIAQVILTNYLNPVEKEAEIRYEKVSYLEDDLDIRMIAKPHFDYLNLKDEILEPFKVKYVMTGIKASCPEDCFVQLQLNENLYNGQGVLLANGFGIIDSDYYNNPDNEGYIGFGLLNTNYKQITIPEGILLGRSVVRKYYTLTEDNVVEESRRGGLGSTGN